MFALRSSLLAVFLFLGAIAQALTVTQEKLTALEQQIELEADVQIESIQYQKDPTHVFRWTASAKILTLRSQNRSLTFRQGDRILIQGIGGENDQRGVRWLGIPKPFVSRSYRAKLKQGSNGTFQIVGFEFGLAPLGGRVFTRNRTDGSDGAGTGPFLRWELEYFPIPFYISSPTFSNRPEFVTAIYESFKTWRIVEGSYVDFLGFGCTSKEINENDGINSLVFVQSDWPFDSSVIAITRNFFVAGQSPESGLILDSDILLNAVDHAFTTTNETGAHDVQNIVTHEIGHMLGLGHEAPPIDVEASMYAIAAPNEFFKRTLKENDLLGLLDGYQGTIEKVGDHSIECQVADGTVGCAAAKQRGHWSDTLLPAFILFLSLIIGRCFVSDRPTPSSL